MYVVTATTAEEMRVAVVEFLVERARSHQRLARLNTRKRTIAEHQQWSAAMGDAAKFFREPTINPAA